MQLRILFLLLWASFALSSQVHAQNPSLIISYVKSDSLFVCGSDTFTVKITNAGGVLPAGAALNISLPAGLEYVASSITGATELNISDLQSPQFVLPAIGAGTTASVRYLIHADCRAAMVLDAGGLFNSGITITAPNVNVGVTTSSIPVETGLLLIQSIHDTIMSGEKDDTLHRLICVKNTRLGKIGNLHFEDLHAPGIEISIQNAAVQNSTATALTAEFSSAVFTSQGNQDTWLDLGETVCLDEKIIIHDCGIPEWQNNSLIRVGWGCGPGVCRYDSTLAGIRIMPSTKVPVLTTKTIWNPPVDNCGHTGSTTGVHIVNTGNGNAEMVSLKFSMGLAGQIMAIAPGSFRIVASNGTITPLDPNLTSQGAFSCDPQAYYTANTIIPLLAAQDSIDLLFDAVYCNEECVQLLKPINVELFYRKPCPVNGFVSDTFSINPNSDFVIRSEIDFNNSGHCLMPGGNYQGNYRVISRRLTQTDGVLHLQMNFPAGFTLDHSCPLALDGHAPLHVSESTDNQHITYLDFAFQLPIQHDSAEMHFCFHYECDSLLDCHLSVPLPNGSQGIFVVDCNHPCTAELDYKTIWIQNDQVPVGCGIGDCDKLYLIADVPCKTLEPDSISGTLAHLTWKFEARRNNRGYRDADGDRQADSRDPALAQQIRLDRFLAGDTMRIYYCAVLDSGSLPYLPRSFYHEIVKSDFGGPENNDPVKMAAAQLGFVNSDFFRFLNDTLHIHYHTGEQVTLPLQDLISKVDKNYFSILRPNVYPYVILDELTSQQHNCITNFAALYSAGLLPKPVITVGDSVFITTYFKLGMNFNLSFTGQGDPPLVGFRTAMDHRPLTFAWNLIPSSKMQYSGYNLKRSPVLFSIKPCEPSVQVKKFRFSLRIAREDLFPFEVRPLARLSKFLLSVPPELDLASVKMSYLALQDSLPLLSNVPLVYNLGPAGLNVDFGPAFLLPLDEGFSLGADIQFQPSCTFSKPDSIHLHVETTFNACLKGQNNVDSVNLVNTLGYFSNHPELQLSTLDSVIHSVEKTFKVQFSLEDPTISPAPHPWIKIGPGSPAISGFHLFKMPGNQEIIAQNGVYNLNQIIGFTNNNFVLTGLNQSCNTDSVTIYFGWSCNALSGVNDYSCYSDSFVVHLNLEKPELELDVVHEPDMITLCDTSDYFEYEIYNAKTGFAYDVFGTVHLPQGLEVVPGTSQIFYAPAGAWVNIGDPDLLTGNIFRWDINASQATIAANGLPGVQQMPANTIRIRFKVTAICGFVANSQNIYGTYGKEACGKSTNILNKPGDPIQIEGLAPSYDVLVSANLESPGDAICGGEQEFSAHLAAFGTPGIEDSVYVYFPAGISYVAGSYVPGLNAPAGPPTIIAGGFRLPLPQLSGGGIFDFKFKLHYDNGAGCSEQLIQFQTRVHSQALCQSTGTLCDVYVSTGEYSLNLQVLHPELHMTSATLALDDNNTGNFTVSIVNNGLYQADGTNVEIWADNDQNGIVSSPDVLIATLTNADLLLAGASTVLNGSAPVDPALLCHLIAVLPAQNNCICQTETVPVSTLQVQHAVLIICDPAPQTIGVMQQNGFSYQWNPDPAISCGNCGITVYTPDSTLASGAMIHLQLIESDGTCTIQHQFDINFGVVAHIMAGNSTICQGTSVSLTATPAGQQYTWSGPGILHPESQVQVLSPAQSSIYSVVVAAANGCTATASYPVTVLPADSTILTPIEACEGSMIDVFGMTVPAAAGITQKQLLNASGCDSTIFQEVKILHKVATESFVSFCQGAPVQVFDTTLTTSGKLCKIYTGVNGCDSTHCITATMNLPPDLSNPDTLMVTLGNTVELGGYPGYAQYTWNPAPEPPCPNCNVIQVTPDSAGFGEYVLTVLDNNGCSDTVVWRFVVFPPCDPRNVMIPNAFTPNNDGSNDVFRPIASEGGELFGKLTVFDRWGEKVFENTGAVYWDGTIRGKEAPSDVYVYIIEVECPEGKGRRVGQVTLLR